MPYPWPSFGSFIFSGDEHSIFRSDLGWSRRLALSQQRVLGTATDSIVTLAAGSAVRTFDCYLTFDRFATLQALVNTTALFTDWTNPTPDSRQAFLKAVTPLDRTTQFYCPAGATAERRRIRTRVELVSQ